jgi:alpha-L-fucosidase
MNLRAQAVGLALAVAALSAFGSRDLAAQPAPLEPDLHVNPARLAEWNGWRFGMFIHWGPWSQTKIGYIWKITLEDSPKVREQRFDLWKTFNPTQFDPKKWARAAKDAGMKYVVFVVKHHDGFNNYDTALSDYKITAAGSPFAKNPNADLTRAVIDAFRAEGLAIGLYFSHIDWHHPDGKYFSRSHWDYDATRVDRDPASWERFADYEIGQVRELLTNYGKIDIVWFDINWPFAGTGPVRTTNPRVRASILKLLTTMKSLQPDIIFNDRGTDLYGGFYTPEQRVPETGLPGNWEANLTITNGRGFWYKGDGVSAKSPAELIHMLIDIASKGGNFLLNVGPRPDGELSPGEYTGLAGVGAWTKIYGESIYGTTRSLLLDLPWGRSTTKDRTLYLHVFDWPKDGRLVVPGVRTAVKNAWRVADASRRPLRVTAQGDDKIIEVGATPDPAIVSVVALELAGDPDIKNIIRQSESAPLTLPATRAEIESRTAHYNYGHDIRHGDFIEDLRSSADRVSWHFSLNRAGRYRVVAEYAVQTSEAGSHFTAQIDGLPPLNATTQATADWQGALLDVRSKPGSTGEANDNRWTFKANDLGTVVFDAVGEHTLVINPKTIAKDYLFYLKSVTLAPVGP